MFLFKGIIFTLQFIRIIVSYTLACNKKIFQVKLTNKKENDTMTSLHSGGFNMLDKSVPYAGFYMRREAGTPVFFSPLPAGFNFVLYSAGDESAWARIEASVLEFDSEFAALMHFNEKFMPFSDELRRRCLFIENSDGYKVATATAWWFDVAGERRPWLHWVAVIPEYQDLGLGKSIISRVTEMMIEIDGDKDFFLHTQTWSHKAVKIYKMNGFEPTAEKALYKTQGSDYKKAMNILRGVAHA